MCGSGVLWLWLSLIVGLSCLFFRFVFKVKKIEVNLLWWSIWWSGFDVYISSEL